jgi:hypothetical protein
MHGICFQNKRRTFVQVDIQTQHTFVFSIVGVRHYPIEGNTLMGDDQSTTLPVSRGIPVGEETFHKVYVCVFK